MHPYDRQHPKGMVRDHHPNDRQPSQSTASSPPHWTAGRKDGTLATGGMPCLLLGRARAMREPGCNRTDPKAHTYLPGTFQTQSQPTLTRAPEKCDGGEQRAPGRGPFRSANPAPPPPTRLNLRGRIAESIRFPSDGFTYFLTLFSKFFSSFPHGTCSLSVSRQYLALDGVYHPFWAAFPNNPTLRKHIVSGRRRHRRGCHPLRRAVPSNLGTADPPRKCFSQLQLADASTGDFKFELFPLHSPLLRESLLVSFPPLINMLKFSG